MKEPTIYTRRTFLRNTVMGGALTWTVPAFLQATIETLQAAPQSGRDSPILVVLQLAGGNDGLNTLVPFGNDFYYKARPVLAVPRKEVLALDTQVGLHPSLTGLKSLFDDGHLAIVQGVGYPNPNRSHFRSTEIWQTAADSDRVESYGWLGRYFDNQCPGCDASVGVCLGRETPQAFAAKSPTGVTFENPQQYRMTDPSGPGKGPEDALFAEMNRPEDATTGASVGSLAGRRSHGTETALNFLERTALDAQVSSDRIREIAGRGGERNGYPSTQLGRELELVSRLIAGGMDTRVYYVSQGGYDTHTGQSGTHERLLKEFGDALHAFCSDLKTKRILDRVLVMTFSEFGRRVAENASKGTDHGTAAPLFVAGAAVRAGLRGIEPSLNPKDLDQGDLRFTVDFRSVYAAILEKHLSAPSQQVLGKTFPILDIVGRERS